MVILANDRCGPGETAARWATRRLTRLRSEGRERAHSPGCRGLHQRQLSSRQAVFRCHREPKSVHSSESALSGLRLSSFRGPAAVKVAIDANLIDTANCAKDRPIFQTRHSLNGHSPPKVAVLWGCPLNNRFKRPAAMPHFARR